VESIQKTPDRRVLRYLEFYTKRLNELPPEEIAASYHFDSPTELYRTLKNDGFPVCEVCGATPVKVDHCAPSKPRRNLNTSTGQRQELPPMVAAHYLFEAGIERSRKLTGQLLARKDYRQDGLIVSELRAPLLEPVEQEAGRSYVIQPPDAEPDEHGSVEFTLAEAYRLVPAGGGRYPDEQIAGLIGSTVLSGESADELLDTLRPGADDKVRQKVHRLVEGKDGLKARARQIASIMRGGTSGQGQSVEESFNPEEHAAIWIIAEQRLIARQRKRSVSDSEILEKLRSNPRLLRETKKRREITLDDVRRWGAIRPQGFFG
jgi:hypothetical protein